MQAAQHQTVPPPVPVMPAAAPRDGFSPRDMARHLRRNSPDAAFCFASAMHDGVAWANERWAAYWADVMRLV